jgi:hypothetical protein
MSSAIDFNRDELIKLNKEYQRLSEYGDEEFEAMQFVEASMGRSKPIAFFKKQVKDEMKKIKQQMLQYTNPLTTKP